LAQTIETKYAPGFAKLFDRLTAAGSRTRRAPELR